MHRENFPFLLGKMFCSSKSFSSFRSVSTRFFIYWFLILKKPVKLRFITFDCELINNSLPHFSSSGISIIFIIVKHILLQSCHISDRIKSDDKSRKPQAAKYEEHRQFCYFWWCGIFIFMGIVTCRWVDFNSRPDVCMNMLIFVQSWSHPMIKYVILGIV